MADFLDYFFSKPEEGKKKRKSGGKGEKDPKKPKKTEATKKNSIAARIALRDLLVQIAAHMKRQEFDQARKLLANPRLVSQTTIKKLWESYGTGDAFLFATFLQQFLDVFSPEQRVQLKLGGATVGHLKILLDSVCSFTLVSTLLAREAEE